MAAVNTWSGSTLGTSLTITVSGATANNILIASISTNDGYVNTPAGWTLIRDATANSRLDDIIFYRIATGNSSDDFAYNPAASSRIAIAVAEYTGNDSVSPIVADAANRAVSPNNSGNISPADDGFLVGVATGSYSTISVITGVTSGFSSDIFASQGTAAARPSTEIYSDTSGYTGSGPYSFEVTSPNVAAFTSAILAIKSAGGGGGLTLDLDAATFNLTGGDLDLLGNRLFALDSGAYSLTGGDLEVSLALQLALEGGTYSLTGGDLDLSLALQFILDAGTYSLTGGDLGFNLTRQLVLNEGTFLLTGGTLDIVPPAQAFVIDLDEGSFVLVGEDLQLAANRALSMDQGNFNVTGGAIDFLATRVLNVDPGSFELVGEEVEILFNRLLELDAGAFDYTGGDLTFFNGRVMLLEGGDYELTGGSVTFVYSGAARVISIIGIPIIQP